MPDKTPLQEYQDALMELLSSGLSDKEILDSLKADSRFEAYRDYVDGFDPDMVAVARELVCAWAKRKPPQEDSGD